MSHVWESGRLWAGRRRIGPYHQSSVQSESREGNRRKFSILHNSQLELSEKVICAECSGYIHGISDFKARVHLIQKMFLEIECQAELTLINIIRTNYGLTEMLDDGEEANHIESGVEGDYNTEEELELDETQYLEVKTSLDECDAIPKSSKTSKSQKRTVKRTENEKLYEFKCHICGVEFSKMQLLTTHCKSSHQSFPKVLCWCGAVLSTWKRLMSHKSKHLKQNDQFSCTECKISYKTRIAFEKHFSMKHGPDKERFICTQCGKEFKERQILKNHEKIHLPDELKLKFPCNECGKKFVNSHCLKIHNARVHQKVALHTCELCGKGCITKSDLKWHMVRKNFNPNLLLTISIIIQQDKHVQERNFECDICNLKFKSANSLRIHKKRHFNQEKKFICPTCGKEFFSSAALSNHKVCWMCSTMTRGF